MSSSTAVLDRSTVPAVGTFRAIGTSHEILATRPEALEPALRYAQDHLAAVDAACSRFRGDSEISRLADLAADSDAWCYGSPLLLDYLEAARHGARISDGLVDFTVGTALVDAGYDEDMDAVLARDHFLVTAVGRVPGWERVTVTGSGRINVPQGTLLDFGATAKAHAADMIARTLAMRLPGGFLVNLGGDIATSGEIPDGGWNVGIEAADGALRQVVAITNQAITTSSTQKRAWSTDRGIANHIIDPRTGLVVERVWGQASCVAATALEANTASTAALVLGAEAPYWLAERGISARLERLDGSVVTVNGWPEDDAFDAPDPRESQSTMKPEGV